MSIIATLVSIFPQKIKKKAKEWLRYPTPYSFYPGKCILRQRIDFTFRGTSLALESDHSIPLYETIAEIWDYDCYQMDKLELPIEEPISIVDIGANIGSAAVAMACLPNSFVTCFEPLKENSDWLCHNMRINKLTNYSVICAAISDADGTASFVCDPNELVAGHLAANENVAGTVRRIVQTLTLASAIAKCPAGKIGLLKCDCEGGEYSVVDQITPELAERISNLSFEVHERDSRNNLHTLTAKLARLGYQIRTKPEMFGRHGLHHILASR